MGGWRIGSAGWRLSVAAVLAISVVAAGSGLPASGAAVVSADPGPAIAAPTGPAMRTASTSTATRSAAAAATARYTKRVSLSTRWKVSRKSYVQVRAVPAGVSCSLSAWRYRKVSGHRRYTSVRVTCSHPAQTGAWTVRVVDRRKPATRTRRVHWTYTAPTPPPRPPDGTVVLAPPTAVDATVDPASRASVLASVSAFPGQEAVDPGWTGSVASCAPGTTTPAFRAAVRARLNWHRNVVGLPDIPEDPAASAGAQKAALMMAAQGSLSHSPGPTWACYTAEGATAAGQSNLYLGRFGPRAISGYVDDPGANNAAAGHRRWILYPKLASFGTGDITGRSNALRVWDHSATRPAGLAYVAWPNAGFTPASTLPTSGRWSFSLPGSWSDGADFAAATVSVHGPSGPVPATIVSATAQGYGDNTLVFVVGPLGLAASGDSTFVVTVGNVAHRGAVRSYRYSVTVVAGA